jgi:hypothetical protein
MKLEIEEGLLIVCIILLGMFELTLIGLVLYAPK